MLSTIKTFSRDFLHIIILLLLWGIAIWDISYIIHDFVNDNRYTLVTPIEGTPNQSLPFLEDVEICFTYVSNYGVLNGIWFHNNETKNIMDQEYTSDTNITLTIDILKNIDYSTDEYGRLNLTKREFIHAYRYFEILGAMDRRYRSDERENKSDSNDCKSEFINEHKFFIDLISTDQLELLEQTIHSRILGWDPNITEETTSYMNITFLNKQVICQYIKTSRAQFYYQQRSQEPNKLQNEFYVPVGIIKKYEKFTFKPRPEVYAKIQFPGRDIAPLKRFGSDDKFAFEIRLSNQGIYDKSEVMRQCVQDDHEIILSPNDECEYSRYAYVLDMQRHCQCTPFTFRNYFDMDKKFPYCEKGIYNSSCICDVASTSRCPKPCKNIKNKYNVIINEDPKIFNFGVKTSGYGRGYIKFIMEDLDYTLYEEKFKMNFAQLIAQVGGDIGMYTGFCVLAIWQFFMFIHDQKKHSDQAKKQPTSTGLESVSWYDAVMCYLETRGCKYDEKEANAKEELEKQVKTLKEKFDNQCASLQTTELEVQKMEKERADLVDTIKSLKEDISDLKQMHMEELAEVRKLFEGLVKTSD